MSNLFPLPMEALLMARMVSVLILMLILILRLRVRTRMLCAISTTTLINTSIADSSSNNTCTGPDIAPRSSIHRAHRCIREIAHAHKHLPTDQARGCVMRVLIR